MVRRRVGESMQRAIVRLAKCAAESYGATAEVEMHMVAPADSQRRSRHGPCLQRCNCGRGSGRSGRNGGPDHGRGRFLLHARG